MPEMPLKLVKNPQWTTKQKLLKKGPKWHGPYDVVARKDGGNGNYLLIPLSGKNKGQVSKKSFPPSHLKRYIHRNPDIPVDSNSDNVDSGSDNEVDSVPTFQKSHQEDAEDTSSKVSSDADTTLPIHIPSDIKAEIPIRTLPHIKTEIPICTPPLRTVSEMQDSILLDLVAPVYPAAPVHTDSTLSTAQILADLANGGVVSGPDESVGSIELQLEVSTVTDDDQNKTRGEEEEEVDVANTQYENQTLEEVDVQVLIKGVEDPKATIFNLSEAFT